MKFITYKFRIYPTREQQARLNAWSSVCRFLWNLALEQWLMALNSPNSQKVYLSAFKQAKEFTVLRNEYAWMRDTPRHAQDEILSRLYQAWLVCFNGSSGRPKFKKKSEWVSIAEFESSKFSISDGYLKFPKLSRIKVVQHRTIAGKPKTCTIKKEGGNWFVYIQSEDSLLAPQHPHTHSGVGIDSGITYLAADSNRVVVENPRFLRQEQALLTRCQRQFSRKQRGSNKKKKAAERVARLHRKVKNRRTDFLHKLSTDYTKNHGCIAVENLNVPGLIRSKCGAALADTGWGIFHDMLRYKSSWLGGIFCEVDPRYTSQTCSQCGHVDPASRSGILFHCTGCGFVEHADSNAATVILSRADRSALPVEGHLKYQAQGSGKTKQGSVPCGSTQESLEDHAYHSHA